MASSIPSTIPKEMEGKWSTTKKMMRSVLLGEKDGVPYHKLKGLYENTCYEPLPYKTFGFENIEAMMRGMPDVVRISRNKENEVCYVGIADASTAHIQKMVQKQKSAKKKKKGYRGQKVGSYRRPPTSRWNKSIPGSTPFSRSLGSVPFSRPLGPRMSVPAPGFGQHPTPSFFPPAARRMPTPLYQPQMRQQGISTGKSKPSQWPYKSSKKQKYRNMNGLLSVTIQNSNNALNGIRFGETYDVAPRFRKQMEAQKEVSVELSEDKSSKPSVSPTESLSKLAGGRDYRLALRQHVANLGLPDLEFNTYSVGKKLNQAYVSAVVINGETFGSSASFNSRKDAEAAAARHACEKLQVFKKRQSVSPEKSFAECTPQIKSRLKEMITSYPNGLWQSRLIKMYEEKFKETPPKELPIWAEMLSDIIRVDELSAGKILYPQTSVKLVQSGQSLYIEVPPAVQPKQGEELKVVISFADSPNNFYIQRMDSSIDVISEQLEEIYEKRGAPKPLVNTAEGDFCVAKFNEDEKWYRGCINKKENNDLFEVQYIDFGNFSMVHINQIKRILDSVAKLPAQALKCSLYKVFPIQQNWSKEVLEEMENIVDLPLVMRVRDVDNNCCYVELFVQTDLVHSFNQRLVRKGLASPHEHVPEPDVLTFPEDDVWEVYVNHLLSSVELKIRIIGPEYSDRLEELESQWARCNPKPASKEDCHQEAVLLLCCEENDKVVYSRVRVLWHLGDEIEVLYLDHGEYEQTTIENLRLLPPHLNYLPYQAVVCKLCGLEPYENDENVCERIYDLALGNYLTAIVEERGGDRLSLTLIDQSGDTDVNINEEVASVLTTEQLKPALPHVGCRIEGFVTYIQSNWNVCFVICGPGLEKLSDLKSEMNRLYGETTTPDLMISKPKVGDMLAAPFEDYEDNVQWYRALIKEVFPQAREVEVLFVDYGNVERLPYSKLRLPAKETKYMTKLPYQMMSCVIPNLPPKDTEMSCEASERLHELLAPGRKVHFEVLEEGSDEKLPLVDIYTFASDEHQEEDDLESVATILLNENLFISEISSESDTASNQGVLDVMSETVDEGQWAIVSEADITTLNVSKTTSPSPAPPRTPSPLIPCEEVLDLNKLDINRTPTKEMSACEVYCIEKGDGDKVEEIASVLDKHGLCHLDPPPLPDDSEEVYVTWVGSPHDFRVISARRVEDLSKQERDLWEYYSNNSNLEEVMPEVGGAYCALFLGEYYRCIVRSVIEPEDLVVVYFCDYGDCGSVPITDLRHLAPQFSRMHALAIKAKLPAIQPCDTVWREDSNKRFEELVLNQKHTSARCGNPDMSGYLTMTLINSRVGQQTGQAFIHKILIQEGLASELKITT